MQNVSSICDLINHVTWCGVVSFAFGGLGIVIFSLYILAGTSNAPSFEIIGHSEQIEQGNLSGREENLIGVAARSAEHQKRSIFELIWLLGAAAVSFCVSSSLYILTRKVEQFKISRVQNQQIPSESTGEDGP